MGLEFHIKNFGETQQVVLRDAVTAKEREIATYLSSDGCAAGISLGEGVLARSGEYRDGELEQRFDPSGIEELEGWDARLVWVDKGQHLFLRYERHMCLINLETNRIVAEI